MSTTSSPAPSQSSRAYASPSPPNSPKIDLDITPRSKVARLLAQFSDSDSDEPAKQSNLKSPSRKQASPKKGVPAAGSSDSEDDDDVPVVRHRARAAKKTSIGSADEDVEMADVYASIQKKPESGSEDDEDEAPKPTRRRILKKKSSPIHSPNRPIHKSTSPRSDNEGSIQQKTRKKGTKTKGKSTNKKTKTKKTKKPISRGNPSGSEANSQDLDSDDGSLGSLVEDDSLDALFEESKLMQLVNEKKKANQAKEAAEEAKRKARFEAAQEMEEDADVVPVLSENSENDGSKQSKRRKQPAIRKASKKALFEMRAETQRLARSQTVQLEAAPKNVLPPAALWEIFGLKNPNAPPAPPQPDLSSSSLTAASEVEKSSPPSSFTTPPKHKTTAIPVEGEQAVEKLPEILKDDNDLPSLEQLMQESYAQKNYINSEKGKGTAKDKDIEMLDVPANQKLGFSAIPKLETAKLTTTSANVQDTGDSDSDDLEIIRPPTTKPAPKSDPLRDLRRFARLNSPESKRKTRFQKGPIRDPNWEQNLVRKAREQIKADEDERKDALRAQGFEVLTEEEKLKEALITDDLVEKARQEAIDQRDRERREEAREKGVRLADLTDDSDQDDVDWEESGGENGSDAEVELSGSESEGLEEIEDEPEKEIPGTPSSAQRPSSPIQLSDIPQMIESDEEIVESTFTAPLISRRQRARAVVKDDDDDEEDEEDSKIEKTESITQVPSSMASPQKPAPFGNIRAAALPIGLTQMFNASMESEAVPASLEPRSQNNALFAGIEAQAPVMGLTQMFESSMDSQVNGSIAQNRMDLLRGDIPEDLSISQIPLEPGIEDTVAQTQGSLLDLGYSQSQIQYEPESLAQPMMDISTQMSYIPDPTPDMGFQYDPEAAPPRFPVPPPSQMIGTQDPSLASGLTEPTVILSPDATAAKPRKGRLIRKRAESEVVEEEEDSDDEMVASPSEQTVNAFGLLRKKPKKAAEVFDKKKSRAKDMFQEAAEESEDEYAGLGGGSEDEETDEEAALAEMADMIDNETKDVDDGHAELDLKRSVAEDEKNVQKLMKDIKHGNLRKKGGFSLADDSDEEEAYRRERRMQRNAAERRRLLLKDENISKLAENRKREAFLKVIEGDKETEKSFLDDDEGYDFAIHEETQTNDTQPTDVVPDSQPPTAQEPEKNESVNPRRTNKKRKPKSILEVQRTVSSLLDDGTDNYKANGSSDSDLEIEDFDIMSKRRRVNVIDRVAVKRSATTTSESTKMAFLQNTDPTGQFRLPALLRRATTQNISETTTVAPKAAIAETTTTMKRVKAGGASINFQYREAAKQKNIEKASNIRKKDDKKTMGARRADAANVFNAGGFS
ncbi:hypothetical protein ABW20_dc0105253 [Dactylellina cionopaga]|nr:hypothetical protein ABW20_dc0105253 [Dactylellina cionopaga]